MNSNEMRNQASITSPSRELNPNIKAPDPIPVNSDIIKALPSPLALPLHFSLSILEPRNEELDQPIQPPSATGCLGEDQFALAFRLSPNAMAISTLADGRLLAVNDRLLHLVGYQKDELIGTSTVELKFWLHPEERTRFIQQLQTQGTIHNYEFDFRLKSGQVKTGLLSANIINFSGQDCLLSIINDITERKHAEEQVTRLAKMSQAISSATDFQTALDIALHQVCEITGWSYGEVWIPATDGMALECSPSWYGKRTDIDSPDATKFDQFREYSAALTILPNEELPGRVWHRVQPEWVDDLATFPDDLFLRLDLAVKCGFNSAFAVPIVTPTAAQEPVSVLAVLVFFMAKKYPPDHHFFELVTVISNQLGSVMQQKKAVTEMQALFAAMTDVVLVIDASGRCLKIAPTNPLSDYKPSAEIVGKTLHEQFPVKQADFILQAIQEALLTQQTVSIDYQLTVAGRDSWFAANLSPLSHDSVIWAARDISESKLLENKLRTSESKMRLFFEAMNAIVLIIDVQDHTIANIEIAPTNPTRFYDFYIDPINQTIEYLFQEETAQDWLDKIQQALTTQHTIYFDYSLQSEDNTVWFAASISAISDQSIIWVARDITDRKQAEAALQVEQEKSEQLLLNILPELIAHRLKQDQRAIAEHFDQVTILFADIVGFTPLSARLQPIELVNMLNQIFSTFDQLADQYGLEKIKTIGDAYMVVGGLPRPLDDHATAIAQMALDMQEAIHEFQKQQGESFEIRIGINTGSVVAGVIGRKKFIYDLWGDAVNVASRMESSGEPGKIQVTATTYQQLQHKFIFEQRGAVKVKGKGDMITYWLLGRSK
ncbi:MAG: adenylate/guanylate cyclase domain-containing protein [Coleofasciculus sp. B1-GNL1-01]|uniref:adenylate/guanylate cyclase domain-containing protein n=1 Tax=Coleofasciculus sp. B1-GNL1-01 TaxID=3068484 RepID=UPI0032FF61CA